MRVIPKGLKQPELTLQILPIEERLNAEGKRTTPNEVSDPVTDICEWFALYETDTPGKYRGSNFWKPLKTQGCHLLVSARGLEATDRTRLLLALTVSAVRADRTSRVVFKDTLIINLPNNFPGRWPRFDTATRTIAGRQPIERKDITYWPFWLDGYAWFSVLKSDWNPATDTVISAIHEAIRWIIVQLIRYKVLTPEGG